MRLYVDASYLLAILMGEPESELYAKQWDSCPEKYSSRILWAECTVTLRRLAQYNDRSPLAGHMLSAVNALEFGLKIIDRIEREKALSQCRTLDAIHIASALELNEFAGDFHVACLDKRMRAVAKLVSLPVFPEMVE
jgi:predicted nucleic acid-binding protein